MPQRYFIETLGCPKNQVDSEKIVGTLLAEGMVAAEQAADADLVVVNTCAFIEDARQESIDTILALDDARRAGSRLVVTGCLAERYGAELAQAMQQALRNLLRRFDPKELEQALADTPLLQVFAAGGRKARGWDLFKERYVKLARQTEREFLREIGIDISREGRGASWEGH